MNKEYKYTPPKKYLFVGAILMVAAFSVGAVSFSDDFWIAAVLKIFFVLIIIAGGTFLLLYFRNLNKITLKTSNDFIEIPRRWKPPQKIIFKEITKIGEAETYDRIIQIEFDQKVYIIENGWMTDADYLTVRDFLMKKTGKKAN